MSTYPALVPATAPLIPVASAVKAQFDNPPDLEALVRSMLSGALGEKYPTLIIDLQRTQLAVPRLTIGWDLQPFMPTVLAYLGSGTELDFTREGLNEGFKFNNPNERDRCGCGESFRV